MKNKSYKILFVCLGNICRSPAAEGVMKKITTDKELGFEIDSAGLISYHQGEHPDSRMISTAKRRGYPLNHHARKIEAQDFEYYDVIIGMDYGDMDDFDNVITLLEDACEGIAQKLSM
jgi:protein-tyrosine phosphatase